MVAIPDILYEDKYKDTWEWDGWKPKAKDDAPDEIKKAIAAFLNELEDEDDESGDDDEIIFT